MKKYLRDLIVLFVVFLLLLCLAGCNTVDGEIKPDVGEVTDNTQPPDGSEDNTPPAPDGSEDNTPPEPDTDGQGNGNSGNEGNNGNENTEDYEDEDYDEEDAFNDLIDVLIMYLKSRSADHDMPPTSFAIKTDEIKSGAQALHVKFDPSNYYFVGVYCKPGHENHNCFGDCFAEYTWVKFESESDIQEYYNDIRLTYAFQINKSEFVTDILPSKKRVPDMEHYQIYATEFQDGVNIASPISFDETFIYLHTSGYYDQSNKKTIYHNTDIFYHNWVAFPCVEMEKKFYLTVYLYSDYSPNKNYHTDLQAELKEYYDSLISLIDTNQYSVITKRGPAYYGLIEINEFVNRVLNN